MIKIFSSLAAWYGGGPEFPRDVVAFSPRRLLCVEHYPVFLQCRLHRAPAALLAPPLPSAETADGSTATATESESMDETNEVDDSQSPVSVSSQCTLKQLLDIACLYHVRRMLDGIFQKTNRAQ